MKLENNTTLEGLTIEFPFNKKVKVVSLLSNKGKTCVTYNGEIQNVDEEGNKHIVKCIIKEFAPQGFSRDTYINGENDYFVSRVLPAQKETFKKLFNQFELDMNKIHWDILDKICSDSALKNYVENIPDNANRIFEYDESCGSYKGIMLFPYESSDASEKIKLINISERLTMLIKLCQILDKFHSQNMIFVDLKPDNFIYYNDGINSYIRLFDFDSVTTLDENSLNNENKQVSGTNFFSAPEVFNNPIGIDKYSDIYSIGAMLFYFITIDVFEELIPNIKKFSIRQLKSLLVDSTLEKLQKKGNKLSNGFWNRFIKIIRISMNECQRKRSFGNTDSPMLALSHEIEVLLEIYEHKGVHSEVILDSAIKMAEDPDFLKEYDENLLCDIEEVN